MTCHIAVCSPHGAVLFSDSQGTFREEEQHGHHKQFVGQDFVLGGAGHGLAIHLVLSHIAGQSGLQARDVPEAVRSYVDGEFEGELRSAFGLLMATVEGTSQLMPGVRSFVPTGPFASIGSGQEFVDRASKRNRALGIEPRVETLTDAFLMAEMYADASNESLTVDDQFSVGVIANGRSYVMGDAEVRAVYAPSAVQQRWDEVGKRTEEILAIAESVRGEFRNAQRTFSRIHGGTVPDPNVLLMSAMAIGGLRVTLTTKLAEYFTWYDGVLGRP